MIVSRIISNSRILGMEANRQTTEETVNGNSVHDTQHWLFNKMQIGKWKCQHAANTSLIKFKSIVFDANTRKTKHTYGPWSNRRGTRAMQVQYLLFSVYPRSMLRWKSPSRYWNHFSVSLGGEGSDENRVNKLIQRKCKIKPDNRRFGFRIGKWHFVMKSNSILETFSNIWRIHIRPKGYANAIHHTVPLGSGHAVDGAQIHTNSHTCWNLFRNESKSIYSDNIWIRRLHGTHRRKFSHSMSSWSCWGQVQ